MAAVVLDCSATLSWFMPDEDGPQARDLRTLVTDQGAVVPMLWPIEIGNVFVWPCAAAASVRPNLRLPSQRWESFPSKLTPIP
jgi:hypothetical protein